MQSVPAHARRPKVLGGCSLSERTGNGHILASQAGSGRGELTTERFKRDLVDNLYYGLGQGAYTAGKLDLYNALALTVRDLLVDGFRKTVDAYVEQQPKFLYYLSAEYLLGRQITQNLLYTGTTEMARAALAEMGYDLDELIAL